MPSPGVQPCLAHAVPHEVVRIAAERAPGVPAVSRPLEVPRGLSESMPLCSLQGAEAEDEAVSCCVLCCVILGK